MKRNRNATRFLIAAMSIGLGTALASAAKPLDEGMWTFDNPPTRMLQEKYQYTPIQAWLEKPRLPPFLEKREKETEPPRPVCVARERELRRLTDSLGAALLGKGGMLFCDG